MHIAPLHYKEVPHFGSVRKKFSVAKRGDLSHFVGFSANLGGAIFQGGDFLKIVKCDFSVHKSLLNDMFRD